MTPENQELSLFRAAQLEVLFVTVSHIVLLYDLDREEVRANPAACALLGLEPTSMMDPLLGLSPQLQGGGDLEPEAFPSTRALKGCAVCGKHLVLHHRCSRARLVLQASAAPVIFDGVIHGAIVTMSDGGAAGPAVASWDSLAHDLRTPLAAVIGSAQVAERFNDRPELVQKSASAIIASAKRMTETLDRFLIPPDECAPERHLSSGENRPAEPSGGGCDQGGGG